MTQFRSHCPHCGGSVEITCDYGCSNADCKHPGSRHYLVFPNVLLDIIKWIYAPDDDGNKIHRAEATITAFLEGCTVCGREAMVEHDTWLRDCGNRLTEGKRQGIQQAQDILDDMERELRKQKEILE